MEMRSVERVLGGLLVLLLLAAAAGAVLGLLLVGQDLQAQGEWLDGVGTAFGLGVLALVAVPSVLAGVALRKVVRRSRDAWKWALAAGVAGLLAGFPFGFFDHTLYPVLVIPALLAYVALETREA